MIRFGLIGATGSVGSSILRLAQAYPQGCRPVFLAARQPSLRLAKLARFYRCPAHAALPGSGFLSGDDALLDLCLSDSVDHVFFAAGGVDTAPLLLQVLQAGKTVSLANKESALLIGRDLASFVKRGQLRPLDSEHNALWQCLRGEKSSNVVKLWLTASGGPFLRRDLSTFGQITSAEALNHPVWSMGAKITIDSATLLNKGIEVLEAGCLFDLPLERIEGIICPGSAVHGAVEFSDRSIKMLACPPDMTLSAHACLFGSDRPKHDFAPALDMSHMNLAFEPIEKQRFPAYDLALRAGHKGRRAVLALLGADEAAIEAFLEGRCSWQGLHLKLEQAVDRANSGDPGSLAEGVELLAEWRRKTGETPWS